MHTCFMLLEKDNPEFALTRHCMLHFLELPKINKKNNFASNLERWLTFLKAEGREEETMKVIMDDDTIFIKAHEEYTSFTRNDRMREIYEAREKALKDYNSGIKYGKKLGREQGIEQGIEQGMKQNSKENARRMLAKNMRLDLISEVTGLSIAEIEALRDEQG